MKKALILFFINVFTVLLVHSQKQEKEHKLVFSETITASDLKQHLSILASDSFEGRETGTKGQKMAAEYLANAFKSYGLQPGAENGQSYFQKFNLTRKEWGEVYIKVNEDTYKFLKDFYAYGDVDMNEEKRLEIVFAGYGIDDPGYSDYTNLDVKGKGVVILMGEPKKGNTCLISGTNKGSDWAADWRKKAATAKAKGAEQVFIVVGNTRSEFDVKLAGIKDHIAAAQLGFKDKKRPGSAFFVPPGVAASMLGTSEAKLTSWKNNLGYKVQTGKCKGKKNKVIVKAEIKLSPIPTENVLGFIEGTDKKDEIIVLTAHYDHLGIVNGEVYNGADDDGTGTCALLEMAQAFALAKKAGYGPRRSILFMPVTGEEKGLLGSEYYTDHPEFKLENTVVDLNVDMIGRVDKDHQNDSNYVYLIGSDKLSTQLHSISESVNKNYIHLKLDYTYNDPADPNRFYYRSDHYNFAKNNIPVIFYFSGVHEDYHQPTDDIEKIMFGKMEKITRYVFLTAWELANTEQRIVVDVNKE